MLPLTLSTAWETANPGVAGVDDEVAALAWSAGGPAAASAAPARAAATSVTSTPRRALWTLLGVIWNPSMVAPPGWRGRPGCRGDRATVHVCGYPRHELTPRQIPAP